MKRSRERERERERGGGGTGGGGDMLRTISMIDRQGDGLCF